MSRQIVFRDEAVAAILSGTEKVLEAVGSTLGRMGRNVAIDRPYASPVITNDGVSIVREMQLENRAENIAASVLRDVAMNTNTQAGDGTTTSVVIASSVVLSALGDHPDGNPMAIKRGVERALLDINNELENVKYKTEMEHIAKLASISAESDEIGNMIADCFRRVTADGVVMVEVDNDRKNIAAEFAAGFEFDRGLVSPQLATDTGSVTANLTDVPVLLVNDPIDNISALESIAKELIASGRKDLVVLASNFSHEAIAAMIANKFAGKFSIYAVKSPGYAEQKLEVLRDIAAVTGGQVFGKDTGHELKDAHLLDLGRATSFTAGLNETVLTGAGTGVEARLAELRAQIALQASKYASDKLRARIARLVGGVCVIKVGAPTETEATYLKDKIDDAVYAVTNALKDGYTVGAGSIGAVIFTRLINKPNPCTSKDERIGYSIAIESLLAPLHTMVRNAGYDKDVVDNLMLQLCQDERAGIDLRTGEVVDLLNVGIIDSAASFRAGVNNALSAAGVLITTQSMLLDGPAQVVTDEE